MIKRSLTIYIIRQGPCQTYACTCGYVHLPAFKGEKLPFRHFCERFNLNFGDFLRYLSYTCPSNGPSRTDPPRNSGFGGTYRNFTAKDSKYVGTFIILEHVAQVYGVVCVAYDFLFPFIDSQVITIIWVDNRKKILATSTLILCK